MSKKQFITIVCLMSLLISVGTALIIKTTVKPKNHHILYDQELELKYWKTKADLVDSVQSYITKVAPNSDLSGLVLLNECSSANIDLIFVLAQGQCESHYGTKGIGSKTNGVFNVGAYDNLSHDKMHKSHKFKHVNESVKPYLELLNNRYLVNGRTETDLLRSFVDKNGKRYASYTKYEEELRGVVNKINKTKISSLYDKYLNLKNKLNY